MRQSLFFFTCILTLALLGPPSTQAAIPPKVIEVVVEAAAKAAVEAAPHIVDAALYEFTRKYSSKVVSNAASASKLGPCLGFVTDHELEIVYVENGTTLFRKSEKYDNVRVWVKVKYKIVYLYRLEDIKYKNGKLMLPEPADVIVGVTQTAGLGEWKYNPSEKFLGKRWSDSEIEKCVEELRTKGLDFLRFKDQKANDDLLATLNLGSTFARQLERIAEDWRRDKENRSKIKDN